MSQKRASSKAITFSGFPRWRFRLLADGVREVFLKASCPGVGLLMPRTARLELDLASPEELADAVGVSVLDAVSFSKELVGLADGCDLPFFIASSKSSKASGVTNSCRPRSLTLLLRSSSSPPCW